jgi:hypothetical protein
MSLHNQIVEDAAMDVADKIRALEIMGIERDYIIAFEAAVTRLVGLKCAAPEFVLPRAEGMLRSAMVKRLAFSFGKLCLTWDDNAAEPHAWADSLLAAYRRATGGE